MFNLNLNRYTQDEAPEALVLWVLTLLLEREKLSPSCGGRHIAIFQGGGAHVDPSSYLLCLDCFDL